MLSPPLTVLLGAGFLKCPAAVEVTGKDEVYLHAVGGGWLQVEQPNRTGGTYDLGAVVAVVVVPMTTTEKEGVEHHSGHVIGRVEQLL